MNVSNSKNSGFTLIELLVVVSIIGLLSSLVASRILIARDTARVANAMQFESHAAKVSGDELAGAWEMNDKSGTIVRDSSGNGNNGNILGTVSWSTESKNTSQDGSLYFGGVNTQIQIPYSTKVLPTPHISVGAWFKAEDTTAVQKIISATATGGYAISFGDAVCPEPSFCAMIRVGGTYYAAKTSLSNIKIGRWQHVFMTYDGETLSLYLDGKKIAVNDTMSGPLFYTYTSAVCIGSELGTTICDGGRYFKGNMSNVRIYAKSLTAGEIEHIYASEKPNFYLASK